MVKSIVNNLPDSYIDTIFSYIDVYASNTIQYKLLDQYFYEFNGSSKKRLLEEIMKDQAKERPCCLFRQQLPKNPKNHVNPNALRGQRIQPNTPSLVRVPIKAYTLSKSPQIKVVFNYSPFKQPSKNAKFPN